MWAFNCKYNDDFNTSPRSKRKSVAEDVVAQERIRRSNGRLQQLLQKGRSLSDASSRNSSFSWSDKAVHVFLPTSFRDTVHRCIIFFDRWLINQGWLACVCQACLAWNEEKYTLYIYHATGWHTHKTQQRVIELSPNHVHKKQIPNFVAAGPSQYRE